MGWPVMKTLLLLRHAKSSWSDPSTADHERPLSRRGKRDAPRIGLLLKQQGLTPDCILSSTAKRARKTAARVAEHCQYPGKIDKRASLYLAAPETYLQVLRGLDDQVSCVLVVGHNPGLERLLDGLTGAAEKLPTAALAHVTLPISSWRQLQPNTRGTLVNLWRPRQLQEP